MFRALSFFVACDWVWVLLLMKLEKKRSLSADNSFLPEQTAPNTRASLLSLVFLMMPSVKLQLALTGPVRVAPIYLRAELVPCECF